MDLSAHKKSLNILLGLQGQQFRIPPYQRPYSWTFEQVDDLWDDLVENFETGHFLGSLVMSTAQELRPVVIDGQQRLTTLMLLMSALRDECAARGMLKHAQRIDRRLVADDLADGDAYFKFKTGKANWPVFRDFVLRPTDDPGRRNDPATLDKDVRARNRPLLDNLARLRAHVATKLGSLPEPDQAKWLETFDKALMQKVEFVAIEVRDLADAFLLFETLNDRGLQLSAADLLNLDPPSRFVRVFPAIRRSRRDLGRAGPAGLSGLSTSGSSGRAAGRRSVRSSRSAGVRRCVRRAGCRRSARASAAAGAGAGVGRWSRSGPGR